MIRFPETVGVNGNGLAAYLSAIAVKRAFPTAEVRIFAAANETAAEFAGAATPFIRYFHRQIGLDDRVFFKRANAQIAHRCVWQRVGSDPVEVHPLSAIPYREGVAIHQIWRSLDAVRRPEWSKVARGLQTDFDRAEGHGTRFDPNAYLQLLAEMAAHLKIEVRREEQAEPSAFDLIIDARATVSDSTWSADTVTSGDSDHVLIGNGKATWASVHGAVQFDAVPNGRFSDSPWSGNCLRIGQAALVIETFDGQALCAAMADILRAISLMPAKPGSQTEIAEYNRRTHSIHAMLADWHAFKWGDSPGEGLRHLLQQFEHRGRIPFRDEDPVSAAEWTNWLLSTGFVPAHADASVSSLSSTEILDILRTV